MTYHPVTLGDEGPERPVRALLEALEAFPDATVVFTRANADPSGRVINTLLEQHAAAHPGRVHLFSSLGQLRYLSLLSHADAVVGNSSSGLIEAPFLRVPTVNIGIRQAGRLRASSVIDCDDHVEAIAAALTTALSPGFRATLPAATQVYGDGQSAQRIVEVLGTIDLASLKRKRFFDAHP